jgi:hypothetical protein
MNQYPEIAGLSHFCEIRRKSLRFVAGEFGSGKYRWFVCKGFFVELNIDGIKALVSAARGD